MTKAAEVIRSVGVLPVINIKKKEWIDPLAEAMLSAGMPVIEVVLRNEKAMEMLAEMKKRHPEMTVGAGTVLTLEQAKTAVECGADFIVSPGYSQQIVDFCMERDMLVVPGVSSASEVQTAYAAGLRVVKFFPAEGLGGLKMIKQLAAPFSDMMFVPTGGISLDNIGPYFQYEKTFACGGSFIAPSAALESGDFGKVAELCRKCIELSVGFRLAHLGVNCDGDADAVATAKAFTALFGFPCLEGRSSVFAGTAVECARHGSFGTKGHIGIRTNSMVRAVAYLKSKGVEFLPGSEKYNAAGELTCIYLKDEVAGFAIHLVQ